ncbi:MAG: hypothetical protein H0V17_07010 [Deltaproteobacteria bacterium]|nr:hypothetical protein [Deltaproteobacteria bacterium]
MHLRLSILATLLWAGVAAAEPVVLAVDASSIYVELGARDGVGAGTEIELLHEVTVKDPRTGQTLRDHFALGILTVIKSGDKISVAKADAVLAKRVMMGDRVRVVSGLRKFSDPWAEQVAASRGGVPPVITVPTPGKPGVDHAALVRAAWQDTLGKAPEHRIDRWLELLKADPQGPYRAVVQTEIVSLKSQIAQRDAALAKARSSSVYDVAPRITRLAVAVAGDGESPLAIAPIERAVPGKPIQLGLLVKVPGSFAHAYLYVKPPGEPGFKRLPLIPDGDAYLRGTIEESMVRGPAVEWYVELVEPNGEATAVLGTRERPEVIKIDDDVREAPIAQGRSHIDAHVDYVDFDGKLGKGFDQYYQAEADFTYRFVKPIYAVRLGFGTLSGSGGPKDVIDDSDACLDGGGVFRCRKVSFSYVYTELEFRLRPNVALMIRPQAGLLSTDTMAGTSAGRCSGADIAGCEFFTGLGMRARLRLGEETGTNLVLGAGFTDEVGTLLEAAYNWLPAKKLAVQLTIQVTDMPVPEDFGVRLIGDVGYRSLSWFYPSLRLSYQARDIDHAGVSGGLAMNFDW